MSGYSGLNHYGSKARKEIRSRDRSRDRLSMCLTKSRDSSSNATMTSRANDGTPVAGNRKLAGPFLVCSPMSHLSMSTDVAGGAKSLHHQHLHHVLPPSSPIVVLPYQQRLTDSSHRTQMRSKSVDRGFLRESFLNGVLHHKPQTTTLPGASNNWVSSESRGRRMRGATGPQEAAALKTNENPNQSIAGGRSTGLDTDSKSVIQQRIKRLYGPAALAGGFFSIKSPSKTACCNSGVVAVLATTTPMKG